MATYFIGDVHGCYKNLRHMLDYINFDPDFDFLCLTGDLVARGPNSLEILRLIKSFKKNACTVLGNHDLHLLETFFSIKKKRTNHHFNDILNAPDSDELIDWLRHQSILYIDKNKKLLMSHAGLYPKWSINQAQLYAQEIENILISNHPELLFFTNRTSKNKIKIHNIDINQLEKIQHNVILFTRMRYIDLNGTLNLQYKHLPQYAPPYIYPWFKFSKLKTTTGYSIIFGHWASLKNTQTPPGIYGLDSGCCWGGELTALKWENKTIIRQPCNPPC
ncbi:bis(5'-nucleosyl)-tetraphosphatase [Candidatus Blochmanniella vafra str. BVAF]|uniref:bis(5'-nucleosyl)-tetraphosphatase (symmetrical) n=1 Tax=Blochmanniella vafra (strain BVAF) TaxID=859654 RepID=E8Q5N6_BLOVB|nr:symmetrical bis(5'-nucleosyl)-tetraphosphatase [Candidatus Blochmannia vafer]ADV33533.1 bis(5'-nucleosyl)-tetraphosphatase [Candidatus Blochmannia vafer str. BVAF]